MRNRILGAALALTLIGTLTGLVALTTVDAHANHATGTATVKCVRDQAGHLQPFLTHYVLSDEKESAVNTGSARGLFDGVTIPAGGGYIPSAPERVNPGETVYMWSTWRWSGGVVLESRTPPKGEIPFTVPDDACQPDPSTFPERREDCERGVVEERIWERTFYYDNGWASGEPQLIQDWTIVEGATPKDCPIIEEPPVDPPTECSDPASPNNPCPRDPEEPTPDKPQPPSGTGTDHPPYTVPEVMCGGWILITEYTWDEDQERYVPTDSYPSEKEPTRAELEAENCEEETQEGF